MWIKVKMNPGSVRDGVVTEAYGDGRVETGQPVEVRQLTNMENNTPERQLVGLDPETGKLVITYVRHDKNSKLPEIVAGREFVFGHKLPEGLKSPWPYETEPHRRFADVYQFPDGEFRLVQTNVPSQYEGKHVHIELRHYREGDNLVPSYAVTFDGEYQFSGQVEKQEDNIIRIVAREPTQFGNG